MRIFRKIFAIWITIYLLFIPPLANAASPGGWSFTSYDVIATLLTASKNGGSAIVKFTPPPPTIGTALKAFGSVAIAYAVAKWGGEAIDWVLDPANNSIQRKVETGAYVYVTIDGKVFAVLSDATNYACDVGSANKKLISVAGFVNDIAAVVCDDGYGYQFSTKVYRRLSVIQDKEVHQLEELAPEVVSHAAAGDSDAQEVLTAAARAAVEQGLADSALDSAAACGTGTHWNGSVCVADIPDNPDVPIPELDLSSVIAAIQSLAAMLSAILQNIWNTIKSIPDVINKAIDKVIQSIKDFFKPLIDTVTDFVKWFKDKFTALYDWITGEPESDKDDNKPDVDNSIPDKSANDFDKDYLRFGGQCPAPVGKVLMIGNQSVNLSIDVTPLCDFVVLCRPAILAMAYLSALYIVSSAIRGSQL